LTAAGLGGAAVSLFNVLSEAAEGLWKFSSLGNGNNVSFKWRKVARYPILMRKQEKLFSYKSEPAIFCASGTLRRRKLVESRIDFTWLALGSTDEITS
jgi:hypothetical protein